MAHSKTRGFSLVETVVVVGIGMVVAAVSLLCLQPAIKDARTNNGYDIALMQLRTARERAIENRQQFLVSFGAIPPAGALTPLQVPDPQSIQLFQWPSGTAISSAIQISTIELPFDIFFQAQAGIPSNPANTPDGFGNGNIALNFDIGVPGGLPYQVAFMPDGSARDINGNFNNGVLYLARTGDVYSTRAVSVFGVSGRIRGWRLVNNSGTATWIQQ